MWEQLQSSSITIAMAMKLRKEATDVVPQALSNWPSCNYALQAGSEADNTTSRALTLANVKSVSKRGRGIITHIQCRIALWRHSESSINANAHALNIICSCLQLCCHVKIVGIISFKGGCWSYLRNGA